MDTDEYKELMKELQRDYLASFPEKFQKLTQSFQDKNWSQIELEFHKLKGTGKTYGVPEVSLVCQEMERICQANSILITKMLTPAIELLQEIKTTYQAGKNFDLSNDPRYQLMVETKN